MVNSIYDTIREEHYSVDILKKTSADVEWISAVL